MRNIDNMVAGKMITKAFIEEMGSGQLESEMRDVRNELVQRNIPVELFTEKRVQRRQLAVSANTLVVGYVKTMYSVFKMLGIEAPPLNDYPSILQPFFHRRIWKSTLQELANQLYDGSDPIFAKPSEDRKRFTGTVFRQGGDLVHTERAPGSTAIYCSEVVEWLSEYRVFVTHGKIVGIRQYEGDPRTELDQQAVAHAIDLLEHSDQATAGYGIDFGVLSMGQTALIEWNDGFALGSYDLDKALYTDLLIARWCQLTGC